MREIKFRAWDKTSRKIVVPVTLIADTNGNFNYGDVTDFVLMQYTGLKDKNGKEIYEGDILQYKYYHATKRWWRDTEEIPKIEAEVERQRNDYSIARKVVTFEDGCFTSGYPITGKDISRGEKFKSGSGTHADFEEKYWDFEVIGNIYENPELIKS